LKEIRIIGIILPTDKNSADKARTLELF